MRTDHAKDELVPASHAVTSAEPVSEKRKTKSQTIVASLLIAAVGLVALAVPLFSSQPVKKDTDSRHSKQHTPPSTDPAMDTEPDADIVDPTPWRAIFTDAPPALKKMGVTGGELQNLRGRFGRNPTKRELSKYRQHLIDFPPKAMQWEIR